MCGIAGFIDNQVTPDEAVKRIGAMLESIAHRGPDARDTWTELPVVFGHNRLSIIDLSPDGIQPMHHFDSVIIFNGEMYNYIEVREKLKAKGYTFKTQSDTEVILAAYREYGTDCVSHFMGMWAFALWDKKKKLLFCSRDRFGIKPFYYISEGSKLYFGSEYKVLKQTPVFSNELNLAQVSRGLQLGWVCYGDETYYSKLKALPAAHNLVYRDGKITLEKYWDIDPSKTWHGSEEEKREKFKSLFLDSIRMHMRADVEVGGCLSGGLDSSSIASAVATLFPESRFKTFTIYYPGKDEVDERPWVAEVMKKYPMLEGFSYSPTDRDIAEDFERSLYHMDAPMAGSSPVSQFFVMKLAAQQKIKVLLDGQGSDEFLGGYMHSFYRLIGGLMKNFSMLRAHREFYAHARAQDFPAAKMFDAAAKSLLTGIQTEQALYEMEYKKYYPFLSKDASVNFTLDNKQGSRLNGFLYHLTFTSSLPSLLQYEDRNAMAFSIESRVPFLDHRLVEFVFSLPDEDKIRMSETKHILRHSLKGLLPAAIAARKDKKGFVTPGEVKWLRGPLKNLLDNNRAQADFLVPGKGASLVNEFLKGDNKNATLVWRYAVLNKWLETA